MFDFLRAGPPRKHPEFLDFIAFFGRPFVWSKRSSDFVWPIRSGSEHDLCSFWFVSENRVRGLKWLVFLELPSRCQPRGVHVEDLPNVEVAGANGGERVFF